MVSSSEYGMVDNDYLVQTLSEVKCTPIAYFDLTVRKGQLCLVVVEQGHIQYEGSG